MRSCGKKKCEKKIDKCNYKKHEHNCGCSKPTIKDCSECNRYKEMANEKCEQANCVSKKAAHHAKAAQEAERRAESLKLQAIQECEKANEYWAQYKALSEKGIELMEEAQSYLAHAAKCFSDCYHDDFGCNVDDYGKKTCGCKVNHDCHCGCGCGYDYEDDCDCGHNFDFEYNCGCNKHKNCH